MVAEMNLPVVFVYSGVRIGEPSLVGVPDLSFGSVQQLLASAGHVVQSQYSFANPHDTYQAFWYDSHEWAHPNEEAEPGRVLVAVEESWVSHGITSLKREIVRDKNIGAFVARYPWPSNFENHDSDEDEPMIDRIFIVHGHDTATLRSVDHTLLKIGLHPVTFRDFRKGSQTNIEILERAMPEVDGFICLMTPDDKGRECGQNRKTGKPHPFQLRARQNVLIEAGYAILHRRDQSLLIALGGVDVPTDFKGIDLVKGTAWSDDMGRELARRLRRMGFTADPAAV